MKQGKLTRLKSFEKALIYLAAWAAAIVGLWALTDLVIGSLIMHVMYVMLAIPLISVAVPLMYTRKNGLNAWLIAYMSAAVLVLYFGLGFRALSPDFLVENLICGFFGFGLGNIFKDEAAVIAQQDIDNEKKKQRELEEKNYISLVDTDPNTGRKANLRKKNKK